jgi:RNA exonuclease 1
VVKSEAVVDSKALAKEQKRAEKEQKKREKEERKEAKKRGKEEKKAQKQQEKERKSQEKKDRKQQEKDRKSAKSTLQTSTAVAKVDGSEALRAQLAALKAQNDALQKEQQNAVKRASALTPAPAPAPVPAPAPAPSVTPKRKEREGSSSSAKKSSSSTKKARVAETPTAAAPKPIHVPEDPAAWERLVELSQQHEKFDSQYSFPDNEEGWAATAPCDASFSNMPPVVAMDCEMCVTEDPDTKNRNSQSLVCVSVINGLNPEEVLLHTLVKPKHTVIDYVTRIHGITQSDLANAPSFEQVQAALKRLISERTIVVGHSLQGDLEAVKLSHRRVIDTALLFKLKQPEGYTGNATTPALRDLVKHCLGQEIHADEEIHDSRIDARTVMQVATYEALYGPSLPVPRASKRPMNSADLASKLAKLRVHRIDKGVTQEKLQQLFTVQAGVVPLEVGEIRFKERFGTCNVGFKSKKHADLAFESLQGSLNTDAVGRAQKKVQIKGTAQHCQVGKMFSNDEVAKLTDSAKKATPKSSKRKGDSTSPSSKKKRSKKEKSE